MVQKVKLLQVVHALSNEPISIVDPISPKSFNLMMILFLQMYPLVMMNIDIFMRILDYIFNKDNLLLSLVLVDLVRRHCLICLERLYDYGGSIRIGAVELKDISIDTWRNALGTITQDTYILMHPLKTIYA